jgi:hypothetical protein
MFLLLRECIVSRSNYAIKEVTSEEFWVMRRRRLRPASETWPGKGWCEVEWVAG